jgi:threonylcarbamoyladenosine tRNA methylthiotransferase MtaB
VRVCFTNLGCKLNQAEVEDLARRFAAAGHQVVGSPAQADLHVVNTCTVTAEAARTSRRATRRGRSGTRTVLTGCWASDRPEEAAQLAGVDLVVPNRDKERLLEAVHAAFPEAVPATPPEPETAGDTVPVPWVPIELGRTRALVKAEDGCDMRCAFCIIPRTRGRQRSRPAPDLVAEFRRLAAAGHNEVVLTGVQISAYRWEGLRLAGLVRLLLAESEVPRLRLTSIAPWDLDEPLLALWPHPRLCRHLHLSLQSGATATLRRMRRPYSAEAFARVLAQARAAIPGVAVTTDVIAGFPGETEAELEESLAFVDAARFAKVHVFPFSPRPGTEAATLPGQVPPEAKRARMARLLAAAERAERAFWQAQVGRQATVLWERPHNGLTQGLTDDYVRVLAHTDRDLWNTFTQADLTSVEAGGVAGTPV